jgi:tRNA(fMet)-specific endonuclease VapC
VVTVTHGSPAHGFLFDTNVIIAAMAEDTTVTHRLAVLPAESIFVPVVVLGELFVGAFRSSQRE